MAAGSAEIRPIDPNEIEVVANLARRIWYACYTEMISAEQIEYMLEMMYSVDVIKREIDKEDVHYDVLVLDGSIIGYTAYGPAEDDGDLMLHKLYIDPDYQRDGHGGQSLRHVEDFARSNGYKRVVLRVNRTNTRGVPAYKKNGYEILRTDVADIGGGYVMDDYVMGKDVV